MELKPIFVSENNTNPDCLYSIQYDQTNLNEYKRILNYWRDQDALLAFFSNNMHDLENGFRDNMTIDEAVTTTQEEASIFEETLFACNNSSQYELQHIFQPLYNSEYRLSSLQKSKGKIPRSWLRIYALRLDSNCFIITGGAIKLTLNMRPAHLQVELRKLERAKRFLQSNDIYYTEDLNTIL